eukprot:4727067-Pyramimonas_sp.AAC.1
MCIRDSPMGPRSSWGACRNRRRPPCDFCHWDLTWSSLWGHVPRGGCAEMPRNHHASAASGTLGGAAYGATKRVRGVPKWGGVEIDDDD